MTESRYTRQQQIIPADKLAAVRTPGRGRVTGSQQFQMMKGTSETLAGRVAILNLIGFSRRERHRLELDVPPFLPSARRPRCRRSDTIADSAAAGPERGPPSGRRFRPSWPSPAACE